MNDQGLHIPTPDPQHPYEQENGHYSFPIITGINQLGDQVQLPPAAPNHFHIVLTVFSPEALFDIKEWIFFCDELCKQYKHTPSPVNYSTLLILQPPPQEGDSPAFEQALGGFPNFYMKTHSLIAYYDQSFVRRRLSLHKKATSAIVLLDGSGNIIWKDSGGFTPARLEHLKVILETLSPLIAKARRF